MVRRWVGRVVGGVLVLGLVGGCGGDDDDGGSAGGCKGAANAVCGKLNSCFPALVVALYGDVATCVTRGELGCNADLEAEGSNVTSGDVGLCGSAYESMSCEALLDSVPEICQIAGERGDGQACAISAQCQSMHCETAGASCGTCAPLSAAGGPCDLNDDSDCQNGLLCSGTVCATPVAAGGACTETRQCAGVLICKSGTCALPAGPGQPCTQQAGDCDLTQGLYCDLLSSTCKSIQFAGPGESCGIVDNTFVGCRAGGRCNPPGAPTGTCAAPAADGASCTTSAECLQPAECVGGSCQLPNPSSCG